MTTEIKFAKLTKRQMQIVKMIARGMSSREIAEQLGLSNRTVEVHRYNILRKTNSKNSIMAIKKVMIDNTIKAAAMV
jgi:DNA-binding NarL/FixJ family response regulator